MSGPSDGTGLLQEEASGSSSSAATESRWPVAATSSCRVTRRLGHTSTVRSTRSTTTGAGVRERRAAVPPPPLYEMPGMDATGQEDVEGHRKGMWVEAPEGPLGRVAVGGEVNEGVPEFPTGYQGWVHGHDEKAPEEGGGEDNENKEAGPGPP